MEGPVHLLERLLEARPGQRAPISIAAVVAHPDDEVIGAGALLGRAARARVLQVTQGAPRDSRFYPVGFQLSQADYARIRRDEAARALALAGVSAEHVVCLGVLDQEASLALAALARRLAGYLQEERPDLLLTQPYEGGHPDHDATAFAVRAACLLLEQQHPPAPPLLEMTSYFGRQGCRVTGEFLPDPACVTRTLELTRAERERKRAMFGCFATQQAVLEGFSVEQERFRTAPRYEFTKPPHEGALFYETQGWPMDSKAWCALAAEAQRELRSGGAWA